MHPLGRSLARKRRSCIANKRLNRQGLRNEWNRPWTDRTVRQVLTNEKYIGNNVYNRRSFKLKKKHVHNPPEMWIRKEGAFEGIVPLETFLAAQEILTERSRRLEAVELMMTSNTITVAHAEALLKATPPEQRTDVKSADKEKSAPLEQIEKLEKEMSQVQESYKDAEQNYGSDLLNLVVAKGYLSRLLANDAVKSYIGRHEPEILEHLELVVNTVSMEEAVQQREALPTVV